MSEASSQQTQDVRKWLTAMMHASCDHQSSFDWWTSRLTTCSSVRLLLLLCWLITIWNTNTTAECLKPHQCHIQIGVGVFMYLCKHTSSFSFFILNASHLAAPPTLEAPSCLWFFKAQWMWMIICLPVLRSESGFRHELNSGETPEKLQRGCGEHSRCIDDVFNTQQRQNEKIKNTQENKYLRMKKWSPTHRTLVRG